MKSNKECRVTAVMVFDILLSFVLWAILIILRGAGVVDMHWALVLSSLVWLSWALFILTGLMWTIVWLFAKLKRWHRRRKTDRFTIRRAKALGVWDKPKSLGGRALELKAWQEVKIKRNPGESDKELRRRLESRKLDQLARLDYGIRRKLGETDEELKNRCVAILYEEKVSAPDGRYHGNG